MKPIWIACGVLWLAMFTAKATGGPASAKPTPASPALEQTPLPPGPWVARMPPFSAWRIHFSYAAGQPSAKSAHADKSATAAQAGQTHVADITRTQPLYHVALTDGLGQMTELWFDGTHSYLQTPSHPTPFLPGRTAGNAPDIPSDLDYSQIDFPDVEWVSPETYIGALTRENVTYLVFQQGDKGATVWIDGDTRLPARWQLNGELRTFEYLPAPTEKLTLPGPVMEAAKTVHSLQEITEHRPPRGS